MTTTADSTLDHDRLEKVRHLPGKITARCPVCAEEGRDRTGSHLVIFADGRFSCVADPGHRPRIWELVGIRRDLDPEEERKRRHEDHKRRERERERIRRRELAKAALPDLIERWKWDPADIWEDSPVRPEDAADAPRFFLASIFPAEGIVWTGQVYASGEGHLDRWRTVEDWVASPEEEVGPMTCPATWKPGTCHRKRENIAEERFAVLDFDTIPTTGATPSTPEEKVRLKAEALAITRWLREGMGWHLAAIVSTGSKSIHVWFDHPGEKAMGGLRESIAVLGIDASLIGHPEHPARLPGQVHEKTGGASRVLWLRRHAALLQATCN